MDYAWFPSKNPKHITTTNQPQENDDAPFGHNPQVKGCLFKAPPNPTATNEYLL